MYCNGVMCPANQVLSMPIIFQNHFIRHTLQQPSTPTTILIKSSLFWFRENRYWHFCFIIRKKKIGISIADFHLYYFAKISSYSRFLYFRADLWHSILWPQFLLFFLKSKPHQDGVDSVNYAPPPHIVQNAHYDNAAYSGNVENTVVHHSCPSPPLPPNILPSRASPRKPSSYHNTNSASYLSLTPHVFDSHSCAPNHIRVGVNCVMSRYMSPYQFSRCFHFLVLELSGIPYELFQQSDTAVKPGFLVATGAPHPPHSY